MLMNNNGSLFVFSGPSGTGKGTILSSYFEKYNDTNLKYSVSATTRSPRTGEEDGINYFFKTKDQFQNMIENDELLEWASFCDNYYGTPKKPIEKALSEGIDVILEIETDGAFKVKNKCPDAVMVYILPPSMSELKKRLVSRGTEPPEVIEKRFTSAINEIKLSYEYDYIIVNDDLDKAVDEFYAIVTSQRLKTVNNKNTINEVLEK